jgi:phosphoribosylformimino-5-aminoimidazole carboxamide ribotide isomerase
MDVLLAADLKGGYVVHGSAGNRDSYTPLIWGLSPSAEPSAYLSVMRPRNLYIADLDRIMRCGDHTELILRLAGTVSGIWVDRGAGIPEEYLKGDNIRNIVGTETMEAPLGEFHGGYLSVDVRDGQVTPSGEKPTDFLKMATETDFDGCILLNISAVGTGTGIDPAAAEELRAACTKQLFYGGGIRSVSDLAVLADAGFDGAIIATAVHQGAVPLSIIQEGRFC